MDRTEAMDLLSKTEILFKKHDELSCEIGRAHV